MAVQASESPRAMVSRKSRREVFRDAGRRSGVLTNIPALWRGGALACDKRVDLDGVAGCSFLVGAVTAGTRKYKGLCSKQYAHSGRQCSGYGRREEYLFKCSKRACVCFRAATEEWLAVGAGCDWPATGLAIDARRRSLGWAAR